MKKLHSGVQLYSVREELKADFEGTLKKVAEIGYEYVEFAGYYGDKTGEEIKALLDKYGLKSISVHQGADMFLQKGQEAVDFFKAYGVKYVSIPWYPIENYLTEEKREETLKVFTQVAELLHKNDMVLQYHNHDFEFGKLDDGRYFLDWLYDSIPAHLLMPQLDVCWVRYASEDPVKYIKKYANRIKTIHFKDFFAKQLGGGPVYELIGAARTQKREDNGFEFRPLGKGIQDFDAMLEALEDTGVEYVIVEQDQCYATPPMEAITISREFLRTKGI